MIVSCGEALIDFVQNRAENPNYTPCLGGSPYNLAIASARLGAPTGFLGKISCDFFGDMLFNRLVLEGIDTRFTQRSNQPSTLAFVNIQDNAEPCYAFYTENSADRNLLPSDIPEILPDSVECLEFGSISLLLEPQAETIKTLISQETGKRVISFDPNVRPMLVKDKAGFVKEMEELAKLSTIVKVSAADLEWMYPERSPQHCAQEWLNNGSGMIVMTRGKNGALLLHPDYQVETPEYWVDVKDTIGAGDTFHAALLVRLRQVKRLSPQSIPQLTKKEAQDVLEFAVKASSLNCAKQGADPPNMADMEAAK